MKRWMWRCWCRTVGQEKMKFRYFTFIHYYINAAVVVKLLKAYSLWYFYRFNILFLYYNHRINTYNLKYTCSFVLNNCVTVCWVDHTIQDKYNWRSGCWCHRRVYLNTQKAYILRCTDWWRRRSAYLHHNSSI